MTLYLADASAVEYWRRADPSAKTRARAATPFGQDRETPPFSASDLAALEEAGVGWLSEPIHLLVPDASSRRRCKRTKLHVCSHRLPERSFVKLSRHVMVASPELTCLFDAKVLGDDDPDIKILFIKAFWQGAYYVCQSSCFNKRHCF